jgi:hypothetical protein
MYYGATFPLILTFSPGEKEHVMLPTWNASAALIGVSANPRTHRKAGITQ